jgi:hypothetical protein
MSPVPVVLAVTVRPSVPDGTLDQHLRVVVSPHQVVRKVLTLLQKMEQLVPEQDQAKPQLIMDPSPQSNRAPK